MEREEFRREAVAGLTSMPKGLPGKFLWDETGSRIFDRICDEPDYYPTRCEAALLPEAIREVAALVGPGATVVEYGSGASRKVRSLLDALDRPARYVAVDISREYLEASVQRLAGDYPSVVMTPVCADYAKPIRLPLSCSDGPVLGFFPGSSIGNFAPSDAEGLLARMRDTLGSSRLLIGADPTLDEMQLRMAYGRSGGLMRAFHLNILHRMNRELGADFDLSDFRHEARILRNPFRVEAHLVASQAKTYRVDGTEIRFEAGESVRTDTSHKYEPAAFRALAERGGWTSERIWLDHDQRFSLHLLSA
ncbi:L-histidine N(alpha)-methyltransferase [Methylobacterium gnaphalii]|uniref:Dimethylhistidine N-methyltransferase n=1 Tax=Methylobacterium gnaphalii TaxID=1010610 RepID=A0A512JGK3_9HYPH|nr:dimethylhistidine N-methyltransferase [Methylobacterium gnaphalii]GJD68369.1 Histidine N-alpha-methyltransferase [Methylobacterium gnaphalii]